MVPSWNYIAVAPPLSRTATIMLDAIMAVFIIMAVFSEHT